MQLPPDGPRLPLSIAVPITFFFLPPPQVAPGPSNSHVPTAPLWECVGAGPL